MTEPKPIEHEAVVPNRKQARAWLKTQPRNVRKLRFGRKKGRH